MKEYILRIIIASIVSGIICSLFNEKSTHGKMVKILTGILLITTVLSPIRNVSFHGLSNYFNNITMNAQTYVEEGKQYTETETATLIKEQSEAYIIDKAKRMGLDIVVEVELDEDDSIPCGVVISGEVAPYEKNILCDYVEDTLGITREYQQWK